MNIDEFKKIKNWKVNFGDKIEIKGHTSMTVERIPTEISPKTGRQKYKFIAKQSFLYNGKIYERDFFKTSKTFNGIKQSIIEEFEMRERYAVEKLGKINDLNIFGD